MSRRQIAGLLLLLLVLVAAATALFLKGDISHRLPGEDVAFLLVTSFGSGIVLAGAVGLLASVALLLPTAAWKKIRESPLLLELPADTPLTRARTLLFLASMGALFVEIMLIRWLGVEVRLLEYLKNYVLLACFWGMGLGCLISRRPIRMMLFLLPLFLLTVLVPLTPYRELFRYFGTGRDFHLWAMESYIPAWAWLVGGVLLIVMWALVAMLMVPLGQAVGRWLDGGDRLGAYATNLAGSLAGVWLMAILSSLWTPPVLWFAAAFVLTAALLPRRAGAFAAWGALGVAAIGVLAFAPPILWGPYQKVDVGTETIPTPSGRDYTFNTLNVLGGQYHTMIDLGVENVSRLGVPPADARLNHYNLPALFFDPPGQVLVVGAGAGNDVAGALRAGARHVWAVEIDPAIAHVGRQFHPEHPYDSPRVTLVVDDARAFFERTPERFDLILFGALDSHTLASTLTNLRLDHYVYTVESFRAARRRLTPEGLVIVTFASGREFITSRLVRSVGEAFEQTPLAFADTAIFPGTLGPGGGAPVIVAGNPQQIARAMERHPELRAHVAAHTLHPSPSVSVATDDWPYLYLERPHIPWLFILAGVVVLVTAGGIQRLFVPLRGLDLEFFFLGAGFLLLEFQGVTRMALLYGSTWFVNVVVITGVLICALAGTFLARTALVRRRGLTYAVLFAALVAAYAAPGLATGLSDYTLRKIVLTLLLFLPFLCAGLVFPSALVRCTDVPRAFGSNLLGAVVGGVLESLSFLLGIRAMVLVALAFYVLACLLPTSRPSGARA